MWSSSAAATKLSQNAAMAPADRKRETGGPGDIVRSFLIAFFLTAAPVGLHLLSQPVAIVFCIAATMIVARFFEQDVPIVILTATTFQNVFVSLVSIYYSDFSEIEPLKSYNFITLIACYLVVAYRFVSSTESFSPFVRRLIFASAAVLAVVGVYFVLGLAVNPRSSVIYLRNIAMPILIFQVFLIVGARHLVHAPLLLATLLALVMLCCYAELFAQDVWLRLTNGDSYLNLFAGKRLVNTDEIRIAKEAGIVITNPLDYSRSTLFNTTLTSDLGLQIQRLAGPNFNAISIGYLLSILIAFLAMHGYSVSVALATPLLLATSAKGPLVIAIGSIGFFYLAKRFRTNLPVKALLIGLVVYAAFVFQSGYRSGDYHVLGLLGGLNGFLKLPVGHTLGEGGNLSIEDFSKLAWGDFQRSGSAEVAVESAFGVLLYQLGASAILIFAFYIWVAANSWRLYRLLRAPALAFATAAIAICLVNGLYQEEAYFVPLSLPVVMGLAALSLGATDRAITGRV